jgi:hypothetical protein
MVWVLAAVAGVAIALVQYGRVGGWRWVPATLRAGAATCLVALLLDAPARRSQSVRPFAALDVSKSWNRGGDSGPYRDALQRLRRANADSVFLIGDSLRTGSPPAVPRDTRSLVRPAVDRALAAGRPLVLVTDGEIDDPDALAALPGRSEIEVVSRPSRRDAALATLDAPRAAVAGDTITVRATVVAGAAGAGAGAVTFSIGGSDAVVTAAVPELAPFGEASAVARVRALGPDGPHELRAIVATRGDAEAHNDTLAVAIDIAPAAGAVFVSTSPDEDTRYALSILRGAVALPTRAFFRVAPGTWRTEGTFAATSESEVRRAVATAPLVVLHGDTAVFGPPRAATHGALALVVPPLVTQVSPDEWYAASAPASPLSGALADVPWDSLPPIDAGDAHTPGAWAGLEAKRARRFDRRVVIAGGEFSSGGIARRAVVIDAAGLWRWRFRGGAAGEAYAALWGSIFDWLVGAHNDFRAAVPAEVVVREGEPVRWRRGATGDSVVTVGLTRVGTLGVDSITLRFPAHAAVAESRPLAAGTYDVATRGGHSMLVVNPSREWLPRRPTVKGGRIGGANLADTAPRLRSLGPIYILLVAALCAEWLARRRLGLR